jgi:N-acetylglutamate synthase-like GNAT family acetyltransferase
VVDPGVHGRGLGSASLTAALASQATAPVVLSTQLQRDVEFYSRIGFHVVLERRSQSQIRSCCRHCRHNQS